MNNRYVFLRAMVIITIAALMCSCRHQEGRTLTSATGSIYECLVVVPNQALTNDQLIAVNLMGLDNPASPYNDSICTLYDLVKVVMGADMPCMPQMEPYFKLTMVSPTAFDNLLKPTRNILYIDIDANRFTQLKAKVAVDYWSHPQAVFTIQAPNADDFVAYWLNHGTEVRDWMVDEELKRQASFYRAASNKEARAKLKAHYAADMLISDDYMLIMDTTLAAGESTLTDSTIHVLWCCNNKGPLRRDLVVYSYPYTCAETFTLPYLCAQRDKILGRLITADLPGTYMGTEYRVFPPQMRERTIHQKYATEVRGLWKMYGGEAMGGPYVSLTRLDEAQSRIVTAEVFVFAPGQKKRNALRQAEAMLYTLSFPQDSIR